MLRYETIYYNDRMFLVKRKIHESKLKPDFDTTVMKQWTGSDLLLKKEGWFYCCEEVQLAHIISES